MLIAEHRLESLTASSPHQSAVTPSSPVFPHSPFPSQFPRLPAPTPFSQTSPAGTPSTSKSSSYFHSSGGSNDNCHKYVEPSIFVDEVDSSSRSSSQIMLATKYGSPSGTPYSTPVGTPAGGGTPAVTPNSTPNPLQGLFSPQQPPAPPTRSQTPSPVIALNKKSFEGVFQRNQQHNEYQERHSDQEQNQKFSNSYAGDNNNRPRTSSSELRRRPSIQKLKELFEVNGKSSSSSENSDPSTPVVKLSRSASSVTLRNNSQLSLQALSDKDRSVRLRRKAYIGSEESINTLHGGSLNNSTTGSLTGKNSTYSSNQQHLSICPPPPPLFVDDGSRDSCNSSTANRWPVSSLNGSVMSQPESFTATPKSMNMLKPPTETPSSGNRLHKPPSSPSHNSPSSRRRFHDQLQVPTSQTCDMTKTNHQQLPASGKSLHPHRDQKPALPVKIKKKSKSLRYNRDQIPNGRTPDADRHLDVNNYFSLERTRNDVGIPQAFDNNKVNTSPASREECSMTSSLNISSPREGFKLSIFQSNENLNKNDERPSIPPKKSSQDRFKSSSTTNNPAMISSFNSLLPISPEKSSSVDNSELQHGSVYSSSRTVWKSPPSSDSEHSLYDQLPCTYAKSSTSQPMNSFSKVADATSKDYVNAKLVRDSDERAIYVPLPTKRTSTNMSQDAGANTTHDYANFHPNNNFGSSEAHNMRQELCDETSTETDDRNGSQSLGSSRDYVNSAFLDAAAASRYSKGLGKGDYEPIDFGENSGEGSEAEMVEVVNKEIVNFNQRQSIDCAANEISDCDEMLHNSLDPIARQVYQDCEEYLLHGSNKSPVPSLMPKHDTNSLRSNKSTTSSRCSEPLPSTSQAVAPTSSRGSEPLPSSSPLRSGETSLETSSARPLAGSGEDLFGPSSQTRDPTSMDVTEVASKVNIIPQGLRTRERKEQLPASGESLDNQLEGRQRPKSEESRGSRQENWSQHHGKSRGEQRQSFARRQLR